MDPHNFTNRIHNIFRSFVHSSANDNDNNNNNDDMPALEPISTSVATPENDVSMNLEDDDEMPPLQTVSDSSESSGDEDDVNEVEMQTVVAGISGTLAPESVSVAPSPMSRMNRRARVEDDDDDDRDRRHPSQRVGNPSNAPSPSPNSHASPALPQQQQQQPLPQPQSQQPSAISPLIPSPRPPARVYFPGMFHAPTDAFRILQPEHPPLALNSNSTQGAQSNSGRQQQQEHAATPLEPRTTPFASAFSSNGNNTSSSNDTSNNRTAHMLHHPPTAGQRRSTFASDVTITLDFSGVPIPVGAAGLGAAGGTDMGPQGLPGAAAANPPTAPTGPSTAPIGATPTGTGTGVPPGAGAGGLFPAAIRDFVRMLDEFGLTNIEAETEDPERAKKLVDALEEVPVGLVKRLEVLSGEGKKAEEDGGNEGGGLVAGDCGCAICWDRLLSKEGAGFGVEKEKEGDAGESVSTNESTSNAIESSSASSTATPAPKSSSSEYPKIVTLPCAHLFHAECLIPWLSRPKQTTCPTCRFDLDPEGLTGAKRRRRGTGPPGIPDNFVFAPMPAHMVAPGAGTGTGTGTGAAAAGPEDAAGQLGQGWMGMVRDDGTPAGFQTFSPMVVPPSWGGVWTNAGSDNAGAAQGAGDAATAAAAQASTVAAPDAASASTPEAPPITNAPAATGPTQGPNPNRAQQGFLTIGFDVFLRGIPTGMAGEPNQPSQPQADARAGANNNDPAPGAAANGPSIQGVQRMNLDEMMGGMGMLDFDGLFGAGGIQDNGNHPTAENDDDALGEDDNMDGWPDDDDDDGADEFIDFMLPVGAGGPAEPIPLPAQTNDLSSNAATTVNSNTAADPGGAGGSQQQNMQLPQIPRMPPMSMPVPLPPWLNPVAVGAGAGAAGGGGGTGIVPGMQWAGSGRTMDEALASLFGRPPRPAQEGGNNAGVPSQPQPQPQAPEGGIAAQGQEQGQTSNSGAPPLPQSQPQAGGGDGQNAPTGRAGQFQDFLSALVRSHMQHVHHWQGPGQGQGQQPGGQPQQTQGQLPNNARTSTNGNLNTVDGNGNLQPPTPQAMPNLIHVHPPNFVPAVAGAISAAAATGGGGGAGPGPIPLFSFLTRQPPMGAMGSRGRRPRPPRDKKPWALPPPPGPTLRERIEKREREEGLRCFDMSCGVGPSDDEPIMSLTEAARRQLSIRTLLHDGGGGNEVVEGTKRSVCGHTFHPACLVSAARVALMGEEVPVVDDGDVEVACSVCRGVGSVPKGDWDEGVRALE